MVFQMLIPCPGGECESPFILALGPNMDGIGFRRALAVLRRGTPWITRGSFIRVGSSLAGTAVVRISIDQKRIQTGIDSGEYSLLVMIDR